MKLISMTGQEISTPQVQAQLTVCRSKLDVIDRMRQLQKHIKGVTTSLRGTTHPAESEPEIIEPGLSMRGMGIRKLLSDRKTGRD